MLVKCPACKETYHPIIIKGYKPGKGYSPNLIQMRCQLCKAIFYKEHIVKRK